MPEGLSVVEWCSLCNSNAAHGTLIVEVPGTEELIPLLSCVFCAANPELWKDGKVVIKERPDE